MILKILVIACWIFTGICFYDSYINHMNYYGDMIQLVLCVIVTWMTWNKRRNEIL